MAHITGGGITDNLPRVLPDGTEAVIHTGSWTVPPLFQWLQRSGGVPEDDMLRTFNMGIGLIVVVAPEDRDRAIAALSPPEFTPRIIGEIARSTTRPHVRYER